MAEIVDRRRERHYQSWNERFTSLLPPTAHRRRHEDHGSRHIFSCMCNMLDIFGRAHIDSLVDNGTMAPHRCHTSIPISRAAFYGSQQLYSCLQCPHITARPASLFCYSARSYSQLALWYARSPETMAVLTIGSSSSGLECGIIGTITQLMRSLLVDAAATSRFEHSISLMFCLEAAVGPVLSGILIRIVARTCVHFDACLHWYQSSRRDWDGPLLPKLGHCGASSFHDGYRNDLRSSSSQFCILIEPDY